MLQDRPCAQNTQKGDHKPKRCKKHQAGGDGLFHLFLLFCPVKLRHSDSASHADPVAQRQKQHCQRGAGPDSRQRMLADIISDHDPIHCIIEILQQFAGHDGKGEQQNHLPHRTGGHITLQTTPSFPYANPCRFPVKVIITPANRSCK